MPSVLVRALSSRLADLDDGALSGRALRRGRGLSLADVVFLAFSGLITWLVDALAAHIACVPGRDRGLLTVHGTFWSGMDIASCTYSTSRS